MESDDFVIKRASAEAAGVSYIFACRSLCRAEGFKYVFEFNNEQVQLVTGIFMNWEIDLNSFFMKVFGKKVNFEALREAINK